MGSCCSQLDELLEPSESGDEHLNHKELDESLRVPNEEEKVVMESKNNLSIDNLNKGSQKIEFYILTFK